MAGDIQSYRDLIAWQKAYALGLQLHAFTLKFPEHERFGLTSTLRRTALLLARQIAEGYGRQNRSQYISALRNARTTTYDLDTQVMFALGLQYAGQSDCDVLLEKIAECGRILSGLLRSLDNSDA
jgi:four helix bundle protein